MLISTKKFIPKFWPKNLLPGNDSANKIISQLEVWRKFRDIASFLEETTEEEALKLNNFIWTKWRKRKASWNAKK